MENTSFGRIRRLISVKKAFDCTFSPLCPESIKAVTAMLIQGGYRSVPNYLSRAKDAHCELYVWPAWLAREHRRASAAGTHGIGPAHQCQALPLMRAFTVFTARAVTASGSPAHFLRYFVVASLFLLREAEASGILNRSVHLDLRAQVVRLLLPASKTDPRACTVYRSWGCVCGGSGVNLCPFHACLRQRMAERCFPVSKFEAANDIAFFPDLAGEVCSKVAVVEAVGQLATTLGLPLIGPDGRRAFGGHVCRVSGAIHLADVGVEIRTIVLLARRESEVVMCYVRDAPLGNLTYRQKLAAHFCHQFSPFSIWYSDND